MADDEQFSLCWNNFNSNLSAGFHESLCRGDLVDVTLAAEGQFVKAHRLVLSVCSPYFRKMFTTMPANQHAFVFLKDVSHSALKDLIQFMYCGEVNVKQEALPAFISTAEALQIKGLTDSDPPPSQSPAEPSTPTPQLQQISSPRVRQRTSTSRSYKIEAVDDSGDDNKHPTQIVIQTSAAPPPPQTTIAQSQHLQQPQTQTHVVPQQISNATTTVLSHKRPARSIGSGPHIKRTKSTIDPLDTTESVSAQQITVQTAVVTNASPDKSQIQQQSEAEYIDLPIELPTKSEPDFTEDTGEVEAGDNEASYVEDDTYGDLRYDESYFTENDDAGGASATQTSGTGGGTSGNATTSKALIKQQQSSFTDTSYVETTDQANSDAQDFALDILELDEDLEHDFDKHRVKYRNSLKGTTQLVLDEYPYSRHRVRGSTIYWRCVQFHPLKCRARVRTNPTGDCVSIVDEDHNHPILKQRRKKGSLKSVYEQRKLERGNFGFTIRKIVSPRRGSIKATTSTANLSSAPSKLLPKRAGDQSQQRKTSPAKIQVSKVVSLHTPTITRIKSDKCIVKTSWNNHNLSIVTKPRLRGLCVHCMKTGKPKGSKIFTYCAECPGGAWMCEACFDELHCTYN